MSLNRIAVSQCDARLSSCKQLNHRANMYDEVVLASSSEIQAQLFTRKITKSCREVGKHAPILGAVYAYSV